IVSRLVRRRVVRGAVQSRASDARRAVAHVPAMTVVQTVAHGQHPSRNATEVSRTHTRRPRKLRRLDTFYFRTVKVISTQTHREIKESSIKQRHPNRTRE